MQLCTLHVVLAGTVLMALSMVVQTGQLLPAPCNIDQFREIATQYNSALPDLLNRLTPQERVFAHHMYRASLPVNHIRSDQAHRHAIEIIDAFSHLVEHREELRKRVNMARDKAVLSERDVDSFVRQVQVYTVYLWTNHGQYFAREHVNEKRSPARIGLDLLTKERLIQALELLDYAGACEKIEAMAPSIFDHTVEPSESIPGDIEGSACNMYVHGFTQQDYESLSARDRSLLSAYYDVVKTDEQPVARANYCCVGGHYNKELSVSVFWLQRAREVAQQNPEQFDEHIVKGLDYLCKFLQTGDEHWFKEHSKEWLQQGRTGRLDYTFGPIETYRDPAKEQHLGSYQADVTIKSIDMTALNRILPTLEQALPFPNEYKRQNLDDPSAIPNASVNTVLFSAGELGPQEVVAAYCLPNYNDIRAEYGSKQIIYQLGKRAGEQMNPELHRNLNNLKTEAAWLAEHDPEGNLARDMWDVHVLLHETLGHGSGRPHKHTFKEGDPLVIQDVTYTIGDVIDVTNENIGEFLGEYGQALEEMRAEIIAMYTSTFMFDELAVAHLFKHWPEKIGRQALIDKLLISFAKEGFRRLLHQADDATQISGAHALANTTIMNYMIDRGGIELVEETYVTDDGTSYTVPGFVLTDRDKAMATIKELAIRVQRIKSTADGKDCRKLIDTYGLVIRHPKHVGIIKHNRDAASNGIKVTARIFPDLKPIIKDDQIVDVAASWPRNIIEQFIAQRKRALSTEL